MLVVFGKLDVRLAAGQPERRQPLPELDRSVLPTQSLAERRQPTRDLNPHANVAPSPQRPLVPVAGSVHEPKILEAPASREQVLGSGPANGGIVKRAAEPASH